MVELRPAKPYNWPDIDDLLENSGVPGLLGVGGMKRAFVAEDAGVFVGAAVLELLDKSGLLRAVAVHPDWRRRGVGSALVARAVAHAAEGGVDWLFASCASTKNFLSAAGFQAERADLLPSDVAAALGAEAGDDVMSLQRRLHDLRC